jgi:hypothetical protein
MHFSSRQSRINKLRRIGLLSLSNVGSCVEHGMAIEHQLSASGLEAMAASFLQVGRGGQRGSFLAGVCSGPPLNVFRCCCSNYLAYSATLLSTLSDKHPKPTAILSRQFAKPIYLSFLLSPSR